MNHIHRPMETSLPCSESETECSWRKRERESPNLSLRIWFCSPPWPQIVCWRSAPRYTCAFPLCRDHRIVCENSLRLLIWSRRGDPCLSDGERTSPSWGSDYGDRLNGVWSDDLCGDREFCSCLILGHRTSICPSLWRCENGFYDLMA